ncbi:uncharacterized protein EI90DRAFT_3123991 [Cantharellus anzutake]|uniref:uncharacterized protein n=1 Tax=Cantharellus anzutake TaxID=1750568 RepID=UPI0019038410|nr:uncharacterized protein EI90DRAFT_3123991 [Cantharellus anzutake]KAF8330767.1 hypothetical protein EI90DRAFT_3123991 [Cantharellus anzutake]
MFSSKVVPALFAVTTVAVLPAMATYMVPPHNVHQCMGSELTVLGKPPFDISIWHGCGEDSSTETPLASYKCNQSHFVWNVNQKAGSSLMFTVVDADDNEFFSDDLVVGHSKDSSCLGKDPEFATGSDPSVLDSTTSSAPTSTTEAPGNVGNATPTTTSTTSKSAIRGGNLGAAVGTFSVPRLDVTALFVVAGSMFMFF